MEKKDKGAVVGGSPDTRAAEPSAAALSCGGPSLVRLYISSLFYVRLRPRARARMQEGKAKHMGLHYYLYPRAQATSARTYARTIMRGVVVVAALSGHTNGPQLLSNLERFAVDSWSCVAVSWDARAPRLPRCSTLTRIGYKWASLINVTRQYVLHEQATHIFLLLDDVLLPRSFDVGDLLRYAEEHQLSYVSPAVKGATWAFMQNATFSAPFIEIYATLYVRQAWDCFMGLLDDEWLHEEREAVGWGYDLCMTTTCGQHRWGVMHTQRVTHLDTRKQLRHEPSSSNTTTPAAGRRLGGLEAGGLRRGSISRKALTQLVKLRHKCGADNVTLPKHLKCSVSPQLCVLSEAARTTTDHASSTSTAAAPVSAGPAATPSNASRRQAKQHDAARFPRATATRTDRTVGTA